MWFLSHHIDYLSMGGLISADLWTSTSYWFVLCGQIASFVWLQLLCIHRDVSSSLTCGLSCTESHAHSHGAECVFFPYHVKVSTVVCSIQLNYCVVPISYFPGNLPGFSSHYWKSVIDASNYSCLIVYFSHKSCCFCSTCFGFCC